MKELYNKKKRINKVLNFLYAIDVTSFFVLVALVSSVENADFTSQYIISVLSFLMIYVAVIVLTAVAVNTARRISRMIKTRQTTLKNRLQSVIEE